MIEPKTLLAPPRRVRFRAKYVKQVSVGMAIFITLFAIALSWILWLNQLEQTLVARGLRVEGTIVSQRVNNGKGSTYYFGVTYAGVAKPKDFEVSNYAYAGYSVGLHIPVVYDPTNPSNAELFRATKLSANGRLGWHLFFLILGTSIVAFLSSLEMRLAKRELKQLTNWNHGYFIVEEAQPEAGKSQGYRLIGHYNRGALAKMVGTVAHYNRRLNLNEEIPILYGPSGPIIVALSSLTRVEPVTE